MQILKLCSFVKTLLGDLFNLAAISWRKGPIIDHEFLREEIMCFHSCTVEMSDQVIDSHTWNDLMLDQYLDSMLQRVSIFGKQMLFHRLKIGVNDQECQLLRERLCTYLENPILLSAIEHDCLHLRESDTDIAELLFSSRPISSFPAWFNYLNLMILAFPISLLLGFLHPGSWIVTSIIVTISFAIQINYYFRVQDWENRIKTVRCMLQVVSILGLKVNDSSEPANYPISTFVHLYKKAGKLHKSMTENPLLDLLIPAGRAYFNWMFLGNVRNFFRTTDLINSNRDFLQTCFRECANLEADLALSRHLNGQTVRSWVVRTAEQKIEMNGLVHPLIENPSPLSIDLSNCSIFISGENGIGKSTLLRALGVSIISARAFGFCYATSGCLPALPVYSSMQNEDSMLGGESLYVAELRRARELLDSCSFHQPAFYLIDEIFRGTNHMDSVAAANAVLEELAESSTVIVTSHNLILGHLLKPHFRPMCVKRSSGDRFNESTLTLDHGILSVTNGVSLLAQHGFSSKVYRKAELVEKKLNAFFVDLRKIDTATTDGPIRTPIRDIQFLNFEVK